MNSSKELDLAPFLAFHGQFPRKLFLPPHSGWGGCVGATGTEGPELQAGQWELPPAVFGLLGECRLFFGQKYPLQETKSSLCFN